VFILPGVGFLVGDTADVLKGVAADVLDRVLMVVTCVAVVWAVDTISSVMGGDTVKNV